MMAANTPLHTSAREPVSVAGLKAGGIHRHKKPAAHKQARRLSPWRLTGLLGLLSGLLLTIVYVTDQNFVKSEQSGGQQTSSVTTGQFTQQIAIAEVDMRTGKVVRKSAPLDDGQETGASGNQTRLQESEQKLVQDRGQGDINIKALGLEKELQLTGLPVERLGNDHLKVNLSSNGLFDLNSALINNDARPALEKLAGVLRKHNDLSIQIVGHADSSGPAEFNLYLADLRVKAVADYLAGLGLTDPSIRSADRGDQDTGLEQSTGNNPGLKRRVEIHVRPAREK